MKKMLSISITNWLVFILIFLLSSCKKFLEIDPNPNQITSVQVFSNDKTALSAISGLYGEMLSSMMLTSAGTSVYAGLYADEIYNTSSNQTDDAFYKNSLLADDNTVNLNFYSFSYKVIYTANSIIEGLQNSSTLTDSVKQQLSGEAKVCRAFMYFYICNLFGDVPLVTGTGYEENAKMARTPVAKIYEQIERDLKDAQGLLKEGYPSAMRGRPNKWTVTALLARVYLYLEKWKEAEEQSSTVLAQTAYRLEPDLNKVFLAGSSETIWELPSDNGNTTEGGVFIPFIFFITPSYNLTPSLLSSFEANDKRRTEWVKMSTVNGIDYYYPFKYKLETPTPRVETTNVLRLAEQYLIRAEARAQQNKLTEAREDLDIIRTRANLSGTTAQDKASLLMAIEQERQIEFFSEWGHRWFDLKRNGRANAVLGPLKGNDWQPTDTLWPIPRAEILLNQALIQNAGY